MSPVVEKVLIGIALVIGYVFVLPLVKEGIELLFR